MPVAAAWTGIAAIILLLFVLALCAIMIISTWKINQKAGRPGWPAIVPVYNVIVLLQISRLSPYLVFILIGSIIPFIGFFVSLGFNIMLNIFLGKAFGKSTGFIIGMILLPIVFYPILAFGDSKYNFDNTAESCPVTE